MIIKKKYIFPIILDTERYQDRFGSPNRFIEMNPSMYISPNGSFKILVRTVNYLKYKDKTFQIYGQSSQSKYYIMQGQLPNAGPVDLDDCTVAPLEVKYDIKTYPSLWYGVEDIRFIDENAVLACIPECNEGRPGIFRAHLDNYTLSQFVKCEPSRQEKNWMPYSLSMVVYSVSPFCIKNILTNKIEIINVSNEGLEGWHGSSNGIDLFGEKLFLIHNNRDRVYSKWLLFNPISKSVSHSKEFTFFRDSYFEFTCSLAKHNSRIFVGVGINDCKGCIVEITEEEIVKLFS